MIRKFIHTYVSVDCVVYGFDGEQVNILLVSKDAESNELKLPGSLIYDHEDVDEAASRVYYEITGLKKMSLKQFRCFASADRASKAEDVKWLDEAYQPNIDRLITVAYMSLSRMDRKLNNISKYKGAKWVPVQELKTMNLPFDHKEIVLESIKSIREWIERDPSIVFDLLPQKFVIRQIHQLYEALYGKDIDIRNFHKKILSLPYIKGLDEIQQNVAHRAARYYKIDKAVFNRFKANM